MPHIKLKKLETRTKRLITTKEAAQYLGTTENSLRSLRCQRKLPPDWMISMGRSVRFDLQAIDNWINKQAASQKSLEGFSYGN